MAQSFAHNLDRAQRGFVIILCTLQSWVVNYLASWIFIAAWHIANTSTCYQHHGNQRCYGILLTWYASAGSVRVCAIGVNAATFFGAGTAAYTRSCPARNIITAFNGRVSSRGAINVLGPFSCTRTGTTGGRGTALPAVGNFFMRSQPWYNSAPAGYRGIRIRASGSSAVTQVTLVRAVGTTATYGNGGAPWFPNVREYTLTCPVGTLIAGVTGRTAGLNPVSICLICSA